MRCAAILALFVTGGVAAAQSPVVIQLRDAGPGVAPSMLAHELSRPYRAISPASSRYILPRDSSSDRTLIILGRDAVIEGHVQGDVVVISGDLYMHPGGRISGRALSIGGGVYESSLASIGIDATTFDELTYAITPVSGGYALDYRPSQSRQPSALTLPGTFGFRIPSYDRSNGLSVRFGPRYGVPGTKLTLFPSVAYRSQLGKVDPSLIAIDSIDRRTAIRAVVERDTRSNEAWISSDLVNSADFLAAGEDNRNYYRADRAELTLSRRWESTNGQLTPFIGGQLERASTVRPGLGAAGGPWTFFGRHDPDDALRLNPSVDDGNSVSALAGARWDWQRNDVVARVNGRLETGTGPASCLDRCDDRSTFTQLTLDGSVRFPTFGSQSFRFDGHAVASGGSGDTPRQRWVYLGGSGSLPTLDVLSLGGDQLFYADFRYNIPIERIEIPFVGPPTFTLREAIGGADLGRFPALHQATGFRVSASIAYFEWLVDPVTRRGHAGVGISLSR
jgi:hypothetical protein